MAEIPKSVSKTGDGSVETRFQRVDPRAKYVSPAIDKLAFNSPHCGALAKQYWFEIHAEGLPKNRAPETVTADELEELRAKQDVEDLQAHEHD
jgi:hypothetical protein